MFVYKKEQGDFKFCLYPREGNTDRGREFQPLCLIRVMGMHPHEICKELHSLIYRKTNNGFNSSKPPDLTETSSPSLYQTTILYLL
jgi:hypothetical protein